VPSYGPLISTPVIEAAAVETMRLYLPGYLGDALAQAGHPRDALPDPEDTFVTSDEAEQAPESQFALAVVATPGTDGDATMGAGTNPRYGLVWDLIAGVVCGMNDYLQTRYAAGFYAASTHCLAHKGLTAPERLVGATADLPAATAAIIESATVRLRGEQIRRRANDGDRTILLGSGRFRVWIGDARAVWGGPDFPPDPGERPELEDDEVPETVNLWTEGHPAP
jgi:hypothetical protein